MRLWLCTVAVMMAGAAQAQAYAQPVAPPAGAGPLVGRSVAPVGVLIAGFDSDGDGRTSREESRHGTLRMFGLADQNKDGKLGLLELSQWSATWLGDVSALPGRFDFDRDADDSISAAEFTAELERRFSRFDVDKDGFVTRGELLQSQPLRQQQRDERQRLPDPPQRQ
ncbi:EF-hand domain-containing protein [Sphingoaurantiacus capsulatus]|uniref:EF-hand domain-containing protein n=1 Tax=Sphingoaurantiacus capsulatus TaxID=1771310 RepID=A0ABV7X9K4_9SPHN